MSDDDAEKAEKARQEAERQQALKALEQERQQAIADANARKAEAIAQLQAMEARANEEKNK